MCDSNNDQIVISGISGRYPECDDIYEFWEALVNGVELNSIDDRRWPVGHIGLPPRNGKINHPESIDAQFFKLAESDINYMDPQIRLLYETAYEAIVDAGIIPEDLRGSRTGFAVGMCYDDTSTTLTNDVTQKEKNRIVVKQGPAPVSRAFGFTGPAFEIDTACASSFSAFYEAMQIMRAGHCDHFLIGGVACHLTPSLARGFLEMRMISPDGRSKCLDEAVDGYCRSEGVVVVFIQKRKQAKRIYASVINCETNADGFKPEGITFPGYETQKILLQRTIKNSKIDPLSIDYIEAHVTGTAAGDPIESRAIVDAYRGENEKPILFGCLKSNIGHTEGASTNCALTKVCLIFQKHCIPPNLHYKTPNPNIPALCNGRIIPVLKKTEFHDDIIPVNSFGFGGVNVHALLKANEKVVSQDSFKIIDNIPRLVNISGRTEEGLEYAMSWIANNRKDVTKDFLALLNDVSKTPLESGMNCRAFMILNETNVVQKRVFRGASRRPLWCVFSALGCQWKAMAKNLMHFPSFSESINKCAKTLQTVGVDLTNLLTNEDADVDTNIFNALVSIVSIQISIVDLLCLVGVKPDGIIGHSIGEVVAGYADGCLTAEEAVLTGYYIAKCSKENQKGKGAMAAIGLNWEEAKSRCPPGVYPACDNSKDGVTVSGCEESVIDFIQKLNSENIFAKQINSCEMGYHCPLVKESFEHLVTELKGVIKNPKTRSSRWLSTSARNGEGMYCNAQYYANNVVSKVMFREALNLITDEACIVEVGPSANLLPIIKRSLPNSQNIVLMKRNSEQNIDNVLAAIGEIYCSGNNVNIERLYPKVEYPVPRETLSLSHLVKWNHTKNYFVAKYPEYFCLSKSTMKREIDFLGKDLRFIEGHCIDGRNLFPATGYLYYAWSQYSFIMGYKHHFELPVVEFRNVKFHRATIIPKSGVTFFETTVNEYTGWFSVVEGGSVCVTGTVQIGDENSVQPTSNVEQKEDCIKLTTSDIYKEFRVRGYDYGPSFQGLVEADSDGSKGKVKWTGHWISFTDAMLHLSILASKERMLRVPTSIEYMRCEPKVLLKSIETKNVLDVFFDKEANVGYSNGVLIKGMQGTPIPRRNENQAARLFNQCFTPYHSTIKTPKTQLTVTENYFEQCNKLLNRLVSNDFHICEEEEKCQFNTASNEEFAVYKKLINSLKEKVNLQDFIESLSESDKMSPIFNSNFGEIIDTQLKQIIENMPQKVLNIVEYNATENKVKDRMIDVANTYLMKYEINSLPTQGNGKGLPPSLKNLDLIVYKDVSTELLFDETSLKSNEEIISLLNSCYIHLRNGGFLLFTFRNKLTSFEKELLTLKNSTEITLNSEGNIKNIAYDENFKLISERSDDFGIVSFVFKKIETQNESVVIKPQIENYEWVEDIKEIMKDEQNKQMLWLVSNETDFNGIIGLTRCLKKEPGGERVRCFVSDEPNIPTDILEKDLVMNVFKDGSHGAYVHKDIHEEYKETEYSYLDVKTKGDLSSFRWYEAPHKNWPRISKKEKEGILVNIYYGALNFKDVMVASGRIPLNAYPQKFHASGNLGMEYSGIDENGNRVMGFATSNALATSVVVEVSDLMWSVPAEWTLEAAATVPTVYVTVYYSLLIRGKLQPKEKVLIHSGSGGVGQAAIAVCLSMECEVFTSVGTEEKKRFLMKMFPQLKEKHFLNSRDLSFEETILKETNGNGVDVILNSLAEEKLRASINCLADFGRFIEIGKFDIIQNNPFGESLAHLRSNIFPFTDYSLLRRNQTLHTICIAHLIANTLHSKSSDSVTKQLYHLVDKGLKKGSLKPLSTTVFDFKDAEKAFRFMASGKHVGKVLLKMRDEKNDCVKQKLSMMSIPQTFCHPSKVYILVGGLGGIGLELAFWLTNRGAKKLIITSRSGIKEPYQRYVINEIEKQGVIVKIVVNDATTFESAVELIDYSAELGPIGGIFNLAMVLHDALMENQTVETFKKVCTPKVNTTLFIDKITRKLCPQLDYFVCFSSAACGRGNAGQSNYGFANSVMESICEKRRADNLHGIAIQWGAVGDVGFFMDNFKANDMVIAGTVPQRIPSFMNALDTLISTSHSVCSSAVYVSNTSSHHVNKGDLLKTICHVLGVNDPSTLEESTTLGDLGMDSLMAVEIKQGLEREYNTIMSTQEIRQLTVKDIKELSTKKVIALKQDDDSENKLNPFEVPKQLFMNLDKGNQGVPVYFIPPIEGDFKLLQPLVKYMTRPVIGINWTEEVNGMKTIEEIASFYVKMLREEHQQSEYEFVAYSFGALIAFEMCLQLQAIDARLVKKLVILDGDIPILSRNSTEIIKSLDDKSETDAYRELVIAFLSLSRSGEIIEKLRLELQALNTKEEMLNKSVQFVNTMSGYQCDAQLLSMTIQRYLDKIKRTHLYQPSKKFKGNVKFLFSTTQTDLNFKFNDDDRSDMKNLIDGDIQFIPKTGDHMTFLTSNFEEIGTFLDSQLYQIHG